MFYSLVKRNSKRNRKENGLFFVSLIISIVAFYIILSLKEQDVIIFLKTMESDALHKLFMLIPALYVMSLFILFFLVYFAGKYQLDRRSRELGMYMMLGMKRSKLLLMLFAEELYNSVLSLVIGLPVAVFISEIISLVTAKVVGLGIISHHFSLSVSAVIWTIIGYFLIRFAALIILCVQFTSKEVTELLNESQTEKKRESNKTITIIELILGITLIVTAFYLAISGKSWVRLASMSLSLLIGIAGLFLFFHGISILFEMILNRKNNSNGLRMFTFRQLQESVFLKPNILAISSLLLLFAVSCFAYGIPISAINNAKESHVIDYTFDADIAEVESAISKLGLDKYIYSPFEMKTENYLSNLPKCSLAKIKSAVAKQPQSVARDNFINNIDTYEHPELIALSSYNNILQAQGKKPLELNDNEAAIYSDPEFTDEASTKMLEDSLKENVSITMNDKEIKIVNKTYSDSIITDRMLTLSFAFIVPDELFNKYTDQEKPHYFVNAILKKDYVNEKGLMNAIGEVNKKLNTSNLRYESYLQNMGRELFYTISASYTTIYLAVILLIIANTVMGVQFLIHQQKTRKRYQTLSYIGCTYEMMCKSARRQITWYFMLPLSASAICSIFAVRSLYTGALTTTMHQQTNKLMMLSIPVIVFICVVELLYMHFVKKSSDRNIAGIMTIKREDN